MEFANKKKNTAIALAGCTWLFLLGALGASLSGEKALRIVLLLGAVPPVVLGVKSEVESDEIEPFLKIKKQAAIERLCELIKSACIVPKARTATKPSYSSKLKRMDKKTQRGSIKKNRQKVNPQNH